LHYHPLHCHFCLLLWNCWHLEKSFCLVLSYFLYVCIKICMLEANFVGSFNHLYFFSWSILKVQSAQWNEKSKKEMETHFTTSFRLYLIGISFSMWYTRNFKIIKGILSKSWLLKRRWWKNKIRRRVGRRNFSIWMKL
jgi:hypothetical protein